VIEEKAEPLLDRLRERPKHGLRFDLRHTCASLLIAAGRRERGPDGRLVGAP